MEPAKAVKEYKDEVAKLKVQVGEYAKKVGQLTLEKDWAVGKLKSLAPRGHFFQGTLAIKKS